MTRLSCCLAEKKCIHISCARVRWVLMKTSYTLKTSCSVLQRIDSGEIKNPIGISHARSTWNCQPRKPLCMQYRDCRCHLIDAEVFLIGWTKICGWTSHVYQEGIIVQKEFTFSLWNRISGSSRNPNYRPLKGHTHVKGTSWERFLELPIEPKVDRCLPYQAQLVTGLCDLLPLKKLTVVQTPKLYNFASKHVQGVGMGMTLVSKW